MQLGALNWSHDSIISFIDLLQKTMQLKANEQTILQNILGTYQREKDIRTTFKNTIFCGI